ncbi:hypothetical protein LTR49_026357 [Elasticomyces elasticus]|nr:hypothetical protein LTR49_026357 [Elasticomyces elasticus]
MATTTRSEEPDLSEEAKLYHNLYMIVMQHFRADNDDQAEKMAEDLIVNADLPVLIRARCYLVLAIALKNRGVTGVLYAQRAIEMLEEAKEMIGIEYQILPESWDESWIDEAKRVHKLVRDEAIADGDLLPQEPTLSEEVTEGQPSGVQTEIEATQTGVTEQGAEKAVLKVDVGEVAVGEVAVGEVAGEIAGGRGEKPSLLSMSFLLTASLGGRRIIDAEDTEAIRDVLEQDFCF